MKNNNQFPFDKPTFDKGKYKLGKKNGKKFWYYIDENNNTIPADKEFVQKYNNYVKEYNEYVRKVKEYNKKENSKNDNKNSKEYSEYKQQNSSQKKEGRENANIINPKTSNRTYDKFNDVRIKNNSSNRASNTSTTPHYPLSEDEEDIEEPLKEPVRENEQVDSIKQQVFDYNPSKSVTEGENDISDSFSPDNDINSDKLEENIPPKEKRGFKGFFHKNKENKKQKNKESKKQKNKENKKIGIRNKYKDNKLKKPEKINKDVNLKEEGKKLFGSKKEKLQELEEQARIKDGDNITLEQKATITKHFKELEEKSGILYVEELLQYINRNEVFVQNEILTIDENAWEEIQNALIKEKRKNTTVGNTKIEALSRKYMKKEKYWKDKFVPVDYETSGGERYAFFNIEQTLKVNNKLWITKIISLEKLEKLTYDNPLFDTYARKIQAPYYEKYNKMTEEERMYYNFKKILIKSGILGAVFLSFIIMFFFYSKPRIMYKEAREAFNQQDYDLAFKKFNKTKYKDSHGRAGISLERSYLDKGEYDKALKIINTIEKKGMSFNDIIVNQEKKEILYKKAIYLYTHGSYKESKKIFLNLRSYKKSKDYVNRCLYKLAEEYFDKGDTVNALYSFYNILDYKDSSKRYNEIGDGIYEEAILKYNKGEYENAKDIFDKLAKVNFKESKNMSYQCNYKEGTDYLSRGEFSKAINTFKEIAKFKDSYSLMQEATYRYGKNLFTNQHIKSISKFSKIEGYKDSDVYLINPKVVLYGEWNVEQINDTKPEKTYLRFYEDNTINSNKELINLKLSTKARKEPYKYKEKNIYNTDDGYSLELKDIKINSLVLIAKYQNKSTSYKLIKEKSLNELLTYEDRSKKILGEETKDIAIKNIIKEFIEEKVKDTDEYNEQ